MNVWCAKFRLIGFLGCRLRRGGNLDSDISLICRRYISQTKFPLSRDRDDRDVKCRMQKTMRKLQLFISYVQFLYGFMQLFVW